MKTYLYLFFCFLVITNAKAQYVTYLDSINIRETPSISAKVIGLLRHNTPVIPDYNADVFSKRDTLGGVISNWYRIKFKGIYGYVWLPFLTTTTLASKTNSQINFLVQQSPKKKLEFKVFKGDSLLHSSSYERKVQKEITNCVSLGTTLNSQGKEIIGIHYQDGNYMYDLFEWNGKTIRPSIIKLNDASSITGKYIHYKTGYINNTKVKMRATPDSNGMVIDMLGLNTPVDVFKIGEINIKLNGEWGYWQAIKYKNKEGFVWSTFVDVPLRYIKSNTKENQTFLFTSHAIYVFEGDKMVSRFKFKDKVFSYRDSITNSDFYNYKFIDYGNMGLDTKYDVLGLHFPRESGSQEDFYIWDGVKLNYTGSYCAGEDYMCSNYTFPEVSGIKDRIIETRYEENSFINYDNITYYEQNYLMFYNGNSLVEVPSKYAWLRDYLKNKYANHRLVHTRFVDLNKDRLEDVLFVLQAKSDDQVIGFAFGNTEGNFEKFNYNKSIGRKGVVCELESVFPEEFEVKVEYNETDCSIYRYIYDKTLDNFVWCSVLSVRTTSGDEGRHRETKTQLFKTNKLPFETSWQSNLFIDTKLPETNEE